VISQVETGFFVVTDGYPDCRNPGSDDKVIKLICDLALQLTESTKLLLKRLLHSFIHSLDFKGRWGQP